MNEKVIIEKYNPDWIKLFEKESDNITSSIDHFIECIEHTGSPSVEDLASKPIIDILIGLRSLDDAVHCIPILQELNYQYVQEFEDELPMRRYFRKPPKGSGQRKFHIHMVETSSDFWKDQIMFRDYLRKYENTRDEYALLKNQLAEKFEENRTACTDGKTEFITKILELARKEKH